MKGDCCDLSVEKDTEKLADDSGAFVSGSCYHTVGSLSVLHK